MNEVFEKNLRKLQLLQLDIAKAIKELCESNGIPYFLIGGTLLGAIRHKGFIPWDDDFDVGMLREDYERFIKIAEEKLDKKKFFLETWDTEKGYGFPFAKVKLNGTKYPERNAPKSVHQGIFVDVFPIDTAAPTIFRLRINSTFIKRDMFPESCTIRNPMLNGSLPRSWAL